MSSPRPKMTQAQIDYERVKGWRDSAFAARDMDNVAFYDRLLDDMRFARDSRSAKREADAIFNAARGVR